MDCTVSDFEEHSYILDCDLWSSVFQIVLTRIELIELFC